MCLRSQTPRLPWQQKLSAIKAVLIYDAGRDQSCTQDTIQTQSYGEQEGSRKKRVGTTNPQKSQVTTKINNTVQWPATHLATQPIVFPITLQTDIVVASHPNNTYYACMAAALSPHHGSNNYILGVHGFAYNPCNSTSRAAQQEVSRYRSRATKIHTKTRRATHADEIT